MPVYAVDVGGSQVGDSFVENNEQGGGTDSPTGKHNIKDVPKDVRKELELDTDLKPIIRDFGEFIYRLEKWVLDGIDDAFETVAKINPLKWEQVKNIINRSQNILNATLFIMFFVAMVAAKKTDAHEMLKKVFNTFLVLGIIVNFVAFSDNLISLKDNFLADTQSIFAIHNQTTTADKLYLEHTIDIEKSLEKGRVVYLVDNPDFEYTDYQNNQRLDYSVLDTQIAGTNADGTVSVKSIKGFAGIGAHHYFSYRTHYESIFLLSIVIMVFSVVLLIYLCTEIWRLVDLIIIGPFVTGLGFNDLQHAWGVFKDVILCLVSIILFTYYREFFITMTNIILKQNYTNVFVIAGLILGLGFTVMRGKTYIHSKFNIPLAVSPFQISRMGRNISRLGNNAKRKVSQLFSGDSSGDKENSNYKGEKLGDESDRDRESEKETQLSDTKDDNKKQVPKKQEPIGKKVVDEALQKNSYTALTPEQKEKQRQDLEKARKEARLTEAGTYKVPGQFGAGSYDFEGQNERKREQYKKHAKMLNIGYEEDETPVENTEVKTPEAYEPPGQGTGAKIPNTFAPQVSREMSYYDDYDDLVNDKPNGLFGEVDYQKEIELMDKRSDETKFFDEIDQHFENIQRQIESSPFDNEEEW